MGRWLFHLNVGLAVCAALLGAPAFGETYLFGGLTAGISGLQSDTPNESGKFGFGFGLEGLISQEFAAFVIDGGIGWRFDRVSGSVGNLRTSVETRNAFLELSPRLVFGEDWQLGPVFQYHFGSEVGISQFLATSQRSSMWLGLQINREWGDERNPLRFGVRGGFDLDIPQRTHWSVQALFQVGVRLFGGGDDRPAPEAPPEEPVYEEPITRNDLPNLFPERETAWEDPDAEAPRIQEFDDGAFRVERRGGSTLIVTAYSTALNFPTGRSTLAPASEALFRRLATVLREQGSQWTKGSVDGHADERGGNAYNLKLSRLRAQWIRQVLASQVGPRHPLRSQGFGENRPLDRSHGPAAWEKNRRVEIVLYGVRDRDRLIQAVKGIPRHLASNW